MRPWLAAARDGLGVAALPRHVAQASLDVGAVRPLLADWQLPAQEIHAVYPSAWLVPAKVSGFVEWLQGQFGLAGGLRRPDAAANPQVPG